MPRAPVGRTAILHATVGQPKSPSSKQLLLAVGRRKDQNPQIFFKETGFRVQGLGFRVQGLGFRESPTRKLKSHKTWSCRKPNGLDLEILAHSMPCHARRAHGYPELEVSPQFSDCSIAFQLFRRVLGLLNMQQRLKPLHPCFIFLCPRSMYLSSFWGTRIVT